MHVLDRYSQLLDREEQLEGLSPERAPSAPPGRSRDLDHRRFPRHRGLPVAQPPRLPTTRHPVDSGDVRTGAGEGRSAIADHPERCPSNRQAERILPKPILGVPVEAQPARGHVARRLRDGISARSATTATNAPASAIAVGIVVAGTMPATARSAARIGTTTERTVAMIRRRMARASAPLIRLRSSARRAVS